MTLLSDDFLIGVAVELTAHVLAGLPGAVKKKLAGDGAEAALRRCVDAGILAFIGYAGSSAPQYTELYELVFRPFFTAEAVGEELALLFTGNELEVETFQKIAQELDYDLGQYPHLDFAAALQEFEGAFLFQAAREKNWQPFITASNLLEQTKLDRLQLERLDSIIQLLEEKLGRDWTTLKGADGQIHTLVQGVYNQFMLAAPAPDVSAAGNVYLKWLLKELRHLTLRGIASTGEERPPELVKVYVALNTKTSLEEGEKRAASSGEKPKPLSALAAAAANRQMVLLGEPGGGKSTFVSYLAYCLAAHRLYPEQNWLAELPEWPADQPPPLPLLVVLRDFARWQQEQVEKEKINPDEAAVAHLQDFLEQTLQKHKLQKAWPALEAALEKGEVLLLLDGLDEVTTTPQRRFMRDAIKAFARQYEQCRFLVTCRVRSYEYDSRKAVEDLRLPAADYPEFTLDEFSPEQRGDFIGHWYRELKRQGHLVGQDETALIRDLQRAIERKDLEKMAGNPLLLTMMAVVHKDKGGLPGSRVKLYDEVVRLLLETWDNVKNETSPAPLTDHLRKANKEIIDLIATLSAVAYRVHTQGGTGDGEKTADIGEDFLLRQLGQLKKVEIHGNYQPDMTWAQGLLDLIKKRAGLLIERSVGGPLAFPHRTIQEYLAGAHLAGLERPPEETGVVADPRADFVSSALHWARQGVGWWQMILFAVEHRVFVARRDEYQTLDLAHQLCPPEEEAAATDWLLVWLAGDVLLSLGPERAINKPFGQLVLPRVRQRLEMLLAEGQLTPRQRAAAGLVLAQLGDKRKGVGVIERGGVKLPDIAWSAELPPAGVDLPQTYTIGDDKSRHDDEKPRQVEIKHRFRLARYPITNAQFQCFLEAEDRDNEKWWEGMPDKERQFREPRWMYANHPRETVSWYQAMAFCKWLTQKLHDGLLPAGPLTGDPKQYTITLPHENEWEVAARWPNESAQQRIYPWGPEFDATKANTGEGERVGGTTAVGLYPSGKNEALDLYDLSGNVWEYCRNKYEPPYDEEVDNSAGSRVLRGGSWANYADFARAAYRLNYIRANASQGFRVVVVVVRPPSHHPDH